MTACPKCQHPLGDGSGDQGAACPNCGEIISSFEVEHAYQAPVETPTDAQNSGGPEFQGFEFSVAEASRPPAQVQESSSPENFADVLAFANSEISSGQSGSLIYHVSLEGIDTATLREEVLHVLGDPRLGFDGKTVLRAVQKGKLEFLNLNPVKASVLISRLKHLPLSVHWRAEQLVKNNEGVPV